MPRQDWVPLKHVLPKDMNAKVARQHLRDDGKFHPHEGRWEFPRKTADRVESFLVEKQH